jgi:hypothetical protein
VIASLLEFLQLPLDTQSYVKCGPSNCLDAKRRNKKQHMGDRVTHRHRWRYRLRLPRTLIVGDDIEVRY